MKLADIKPGMKLTAVGSYANCIHKGRTYEVSARPPKGELYITCSNGSHLLDEEMVHENGDIPELELFKPN